ncbi:MAG TPA: hypothetical protein GX717_01960 [Clostridiaceae bacterium]|nr:hypothetical protein [Clostridiaceae bacterium]
MEGLLHKSALYLRRSSPTILTCVSAVGVVATAVMAVRATPKAIILLEEAKDDKGEDLTKLEIVRTAGPVYIPAALIGLSTIACIIGIEVLSKRNQASLASAYALLSESYQRYRKAANTIYGDDADSKIVAQMAKEVCVHADGYSVYSHDLDADSEKILCYDLFSQRYFTSTMAAVINAQYHVNRNLCLRGYSNLNEFYEFLGIEKIEHGDDIGWSMDELMEGGIMWLDFDNHYTKTDDGMECCIISALSDPNKFYCE